MAAKDRAIAFKYTVKRDTNGGAFPKKDVHNSFFQTNKGNYAEAMDALLDHIDKMWDGYELEITDTIVFKYVKR